MAVLRSFNASTLQSALGKTATISDLQKYISQNVAGEVQKIVEAERLGKVGAVAPKAIQITFSWG